MCSLTFCHARNKRRKRRVSDRFFFVHRAGTGALVDCKETGAYLCAGCDQTLFRWFFLQCCVEGVFSGLVAHARLSLLVPSINLTRGRDGRAFTRLRRRRAFPRATITSCLGNEQRCCAVGYLFPFFCVHFENLLAGIRAIHTSARRTWGMCLTTGQSRRGYATASIRQHSSSINQRRTPRICFWRRGLHAKTDAQHSMCLPPQTIHPALTTRSCTYNRAQIKLVFCFENAQSLV